MTSIDSINGPLYYEGSFVIGSNIPLMDGYPQYAIMSKASKALFCDGNVLVANETSVCFAIDSISGNIGIGKTAAGFRMDVEGVVNITSGSTYKINGLDVISSTALGSHVTSSNLTSVGTLSGLSITGNVIVGPSLFTVSESHGRVGIKTSEPEAELDVLGDIFCSGVVACVNTLITSDERIKTDIRNVDGEMALETLRAIAPKQYRYVDAANHGSQPVWGFVAQEVRRVMPEATRITKNYIPNLLCQVRIRNGNEVRLPIQITPPQRIKFVYPDQTHIDGKVVECLPDGFYRLDAPFDKSRIPPNREEIFAYGCFMEDFHVLNMDHLLTMNFAATRELDRRNQMLLEENRSLREEVLDIRTTLNKLADMIRP